MPFISTRAAALSSNRYLFVMFLSRSCRPRWSAVCDRVLPYVTCGPAIGTVTTSDSMSVVGGTMRWQQVEPADAPSAFTCAQIRREGRREPVRSDQGD